MTITPEIVAQYMKSMAEAQAKLNGGGARTIKPADGANRYRILPNWASKSPMDPNQWVTYGRHYVKSTDGKSIVATTLCNKNTYGQHCPVCEAFWFVKNKTLTKDLERVIQEANAGTRFIVNALHRNSTEPNKVIQLELPYKVGTSLFGDGKGSAGLLSQWMSLTMRGLPLDINVGTDIIIRRTGTGINTNYVVELPNDISQPVPPQVLDELIDLNELVKGWQHTDEEERKAIAAIRDIGIIADSLAGVHQQPLAQPTQVWSPAPQPIATAPQAQAAPVPQATSSYYMPPLTTNQINPNDDVFKGTVTDGGMSMEEIQAMLAGTGMAPMASNV